MTQKSQKKNFSVCIIGSGLVAKPIIHHLAKNRQIDLTVASLYLEDVEEITNGLPNVNKAQIDIFNANALTRMLKETDVVVSLLPAHMHLPVAKTALKTNTHFVNTSYLSKEIKALNKQVTANKLIFINECGLDPGLDHMSTMSLINRLKDKHYEIVGYESYGSGIPAPEDNNNPWGYKFSWSPKGVITASKNPAQYLKNGIEYQKAPGTIFNSPWTVKVQKLPLLEAYPNRDSLSYIDIYGLQNVKTMVRGTLRNIGWSETWKTLYQLGLLNEFVLKKPVKTSRELFDILTEGKFSKLSKNEIVKKLSAFTPLHVIKKMEWLGLLDPIKIGSPFENTADVLSELMAGKMSYAEEEKDMIILHHIIKAKNRQGKLKTFKSSLIGFGTPGGDSAMAKAVTMPAALAVESIISGKTNVHGINIPVLPEIYEPILQNLSKYGIEITESKIS